MINDVSVRAAVPESSLSARHSSLHEPRDLILVDVEQLGHFVQIRVFLSVFDNLRGTKEKLSECFCFFFRSSPKRDFSCSFETAKRLLRTFLAMGILLKTFHRMMPTTTLSLR